jgi:membrane protein implicated in regulation of membrane protease activity
MYYLFVVFAVFGGTIMVLQMVLTLIGLAGDSLHVDVPGGMGGHDFGGDVHGGGDFHGDVHTGDVHTGDVHTGDVHTGDVHTGDAHPGDGSVHSDSTNPHHVAHNSSTWLFKMLSVRTLVAAMAFFGVAGLAAHSAGAAPLVQLLVALGAGVAAMYGVFHLMQAMARLRSEGTVRIQRATGQEATVYLRIPAQRSGMGKVLIALQNRTMEYSALTAGPELPTGAKVVVVGIVGQDTLEVRLATEPARSLPESEERKSYV